MVPLISPKNAESSWGKFANFAELFFCQKTVFAKIPLMLGSVVSGNFDGEDITKSKDEGIMKRIKENGEGFDHPNVSWKLSRSQ